MRPMTPLRLMKCYEAREAYEAFEADFLAFMPELQRYAEGQAAALTSAVSSSTLPSSSPNA